MGSRSNKISQGEMLVLPNFHECFYNIWQGSLELLINPFPNQNTIICNFSSSDREYNINCTILTIDELNIECPEKRCILSIFMACSPLQIL